MAFLVIFHDFANSCELGSFHNVKYVKNFDGDTITVNLPSPGPQWDIFTENISVQIGRAHV